MNHNRLIAWQLIAQSFLMLVLYAGATVFMAVKFLPNDPLAVALPFSQVAGLSHIFLEMALLTGLLGAAVFFLIDRSTPLLGWLSRAWSGFLLVVVVAGLAGFVEGRQRLELPFLLDIALVILLLAWAYLLWQGVSDAGKDVFTAGLLFLAAAYAFSLLPLQSPLYDRLLRTMMVSARFFVAYPLLGLALVGWLKPDVPLYRSAAALAVLGALLSISPLSAINVMSFGWLAAGLSLVLLTYLLRALISRDSWGNLGLLFLTLSFGILGVTFAIPELGKYMLGTQLSELQYEAASWAVLGTLLSFICAHSDDKLGSFRFWLIAIGTVAAALSLGIAGVVQVFLERELSIGYLDTQAILYPLYVFWLLGLLVAGLGFVLHARRFFAQNLHRA